MSEPTSTQTTQWVWVQLFHDEGGELKAAVRPFKVVLSSGSGVADLCDAMKAEWGDRIKCIAPELQVYEPGTAIPISTDATALPIKIGTPVKIRTDATVLEGGILLDDDDFPRTSDLEPLIVTAPDSVLQQQQQQQPNAPPQAEQAVQGPLDILSDLAEGIDDPSTFGKSPVMNGQQKSRIQSWRPPREGALPVVLACKAFSDFVGNARNLDDVEPCDCKCVRSLAETMPGKFANQKREEQLRDILATLTNRQWVRPVHVDTDGAFMYNPRPGDTELQALILNLVVKKEKTSTTSDCGTQNIGHYVKYWGYGVGKKYFFSTCLPTLLLQVEGPTIFCSGAVFQGGRVCVDPLSPVYHMLEFRHDESSMLQLTALMRAIRLCVTQLEQIYKNAASSAGLSEGVPDFPYLVEAPRRDGSGIVKFRYESRLGDKLAFLCSADNDQKTPVFVKFSAWGYSREAHEALAETGFAPKLLALDVLPCGITIAVMECVEHVGHNMSQWNASWQDQLREAVGVLRRSSLVHGDLRPRNLLFTPQGKLLLIDFDFSGKDGVARYPWALTMHNGMRWPAGVAPRAFLKMEHDSEMMERMLKEHGSRKRASNFLTLLGTGEAKRRKPDPSSDAAP